MLVQIICSDLCSQGGHVLVFRNWYISDEAHDTSGCGNISSPCRHLQTVLERIPHLAVIFVISPTLSLDRNSTNVCEFNTSVLFTLQATHDRIVNVTCSKGKLLLSCLRACQII